MKHTPRFFNSRRTGLTTSQPWGLFHRTGSRVLCSDGKIRALAYLAQTADTFFSVPAAVRIAGKYVTGYVATEEACPASQDYKVRRVATTFRQHTGQAEGILPAWQSIGDDWSDEKFDFLAPACDIEENN
jgi:hypothetical protein